MRRYRLEHPEVIQAIERGRQARRLSWRQDYRRSKKNDPLYRLRLRLRIRLNTALRGGAKTGSAVRDLGCSITELRLHLERQFVPGMGWDNYGEWHIDHVRPLASFDLTDREQLLQAVHYSNLQPLWARQNCSKGAKL